VGVRLFVVDGRTATAADPPPLRPETRAAVGAFMIVATALSVGVGYRRVRAGASRRGWLPRRRRGRGVVGVVPARRARVRDRGVLRALARARHVGRLVLVDPDAAAALGEGDARRALARVRPRRSPAHARGFVVVGAVAIAAAPAGVASPGDLLATSLVGIAALTLPHVVVTAWLDRRQRVWRPDWWIRTVDRGAGVPTPRPSCPREA